MIVLLPVPYLTRLVRQGFGAVELANRSFSALSAYDRSLRCPLSCASGDAFVLHGHNNPNKCGTIVQDTSFPKVQLYSLLILLTIDCMPWLLRKRSRCPQEFHGARQVTRWRSL